MSLIQNLSGRRMSLTSQGSGVPSIGGLSNESVGYDSSSSDWPDDASASDRESIQSWASKQQEKEAEDSDDLFGTKEEQHMRRWFIVVTLGLSIMGVLVSVYTYYYLLGHQEENFESGVSIIFGGWFCKCILSLTQYAPVFMPGLCPDTPVSQHSTSYNRCLQLQNERAGEGFAE